VFETYLDTPQNPVKKTRDCEPIDMGNARQSFQKVYGSVIKTGSLAQSGKARRSLEKTGELRKVQEVK
jgi:hypothetical protein